MERGDAGVDEQDVDASPVEPPAKGLDAAGIEDVRRLDL